MSRRHCLSRRAFIQSAGAGAFAAAIPRVIKANGGCSPSLPTAPVAIARCRRYDYALIKSTLAQMLDQIGGIRQLVNQKTITVKINLTGGWNATTYTLSPIETVYTHPIVTLAACSLFHEYGARRVVICESIYTTAETRLAYNQHGYDVKLFESTVPILEWEDTHNKGTGGGYKPLPVGQKPYLYSTIQFNHRYVDTDVVVSIPKMKNHQIAGVTLGMKNLFGATPSALYSSDRADENTTNARVSVLHEGMLSAAGGEVLPIPSQDPGYRVPRAVMDIVRARPIDLCVIDAIVTMHGGEGAWHNTRLGIAVPNLLIAGRNPACTDAVAAAVMGYDPEAPGRSKPFYNGDNLLSLAAECGIGTNRLSEIDVIGLSIPAARYTFQPTYKTGG
jgi:uncharacterized protein (DUF362 family)